MRLFNMGEWLHAVLRHVPADGAPSGALDLRLHDADGAQLAQQCAVMHDELEALEETAVHAPADLGPASIELSRGMRAQAHPRFRKRRSR